MLPGPDVGSGARVREEPVSLEPLADPGLSCSVGLGLPAAGLHQVPPVRRHRCEWDGAPRAFVPKTQRHSPHGIVCRRAWGHRCRRREGKDKRILKKIQCSEWPHPLPFR